MLVIGITLCALLAPLGEEEWDHLRERLGDVEAEITRLEARDRPVPHGLAVEERELRERLEEIERAHHMEESQEVLAFLQEISPEHAAELRHLLEEDPDEFLEHMGDLYEWVEHMHHLEEEDPELFELEKNSHRLRVQCDQLASRYRERREAERSQVAKELRDSLQTLFDLRIRIRRMQIDRLEKELKELRNGLDMMTGSRASMIDARFNTMIHGDVDW